VAKYTKWVNKKQTPQTQPIPGKDMVKMRSGGYGFKVGDWEQLRRFLILGTIGGTYYASEKEMTQECAEVIQRCLDEDYQKTIDMVVDISDQGLALKNDHALFALAYAAGHEKASVRTYALSKLTAVARTGTHLFQFVDMVQAFRGWGKSLRKAVGQWYTEKTSDSLAYQLVKYRQREGWTHRDILRLAHPTSQEHNDLFNWVTQGIIPMEMPRVLEGFLTIQETSTVMQAAQCIIDYKLPREAVPTQYLNSPVVWTALLPTMPMIAMVRNLGVMTSNGTLTAFNVNVDSIVNKLHDPEVIQKSRIHPIQVLFALKTYAQGRGFRGSNSWEPIPNIIDALDAAYYLSFDNLEPTGQNIVMGIDVSGSMSGGWYLDGTIMSPKEFAGAMAMTTLKTANHCMVYGFDHQLHAMSLSSKMRLDDVMRIVGQTGGGRTDASLPIRYAADKGFPVDAFIIYSDGESWSGNQHVSQALNTYRHVMNRPNTKLICVNFTATAYGFADRDDPLSLNIVGNSPDVAQAITSFLS
jgi:60 kDa SS-A/Ro ribonucleoprotein